MDISMHRRYKCIDISFHHESSYLNTINFMYDIDSLFYGYSEEPLSSGILRELNNSFRFFPQNNSDNISIPLQKLQPPPTPTRQESALSEEPGSEGEGDEGMDEGGGGRRANNTIFKTSLSQFRKSILDVIKASASLGFLREEIKLVYRVKNQSVFPKLLTMVRALRIEAEVQLSWANRKQNLLAKKGRHLLQSKFAANRFEELRKSIEIMDLSYEETDLQRSFEIYWGHYKQHQKYQKCKREVQDFARAFEESRRHIASYDLQEQRVKAQRGGKKSARKHQASK